MKTSVLLLAFAAIITANSNVAAGDAVLSPKAAQFQHESRKVAGGTADSLDRRVMTASPKANAFAESGRKVTGTTPDLLARNTGAHSPRGLANNPALAAQFQIAPLK